MAYYIGCERRHCPSRPAPDRRGRIEIEVPFNAPLDRATRIFVDTAAGIRTEESTANQCTVQGDLFPKVVRGESDVPTPLEDSIRNMAVIEAIFKFGGEAGWVEPRVAWSRTWPAAAAWKSRGKWTVLDRL
jgi:hypothetical protein